MERPQNCILVIFGASGDLTKRKLIPGLFSLYRRELLPPRFAVIGVGRTPLSDRDFRGRMIEALDTVEADQDARDRFCPSLYYQSLDTASAPDYARLARKLFEVAQERKTGGNVLFYMSTPPSLFEPIVRGIETHSMSVEGGGWRRLIVEKPFGYDLESGRRLNDNLHRVFREDQIYRIDHYLGKETVQNILVFRFANGIFEPLWNRNYVDRVEITAAEQIGVEGRGGYYDGSGALRDMFQNHLLQVLGVVAMEPPSSFNATSVRNETIKVFESFRALKREDLPSHVVRGQYTAATVRGKAVPGYRDEDGVPPDSKTETYAAVRLFVDNWRWAGVPFTVRTGKRLPTRVTEVVIHFKQTPHRLFSPAADGCYGCNSLILRIQPDEGILMKFNMKLPGSGFDVKDVAMDFHYADLADVYAPEAYERLLLDCMIGDATLYARSDAVEACWTFVDPILKAWTDDSIPLFGYPAGTWGPLEARALLGDPALDWRYPCRNLSNDGTYCEL